VRFASFAPEDERRTKNEHMYVIPEVLPLHFSRGDDPRLPFTVLNATTEARAKWFTSGDLTMAVFP
jgi:hypothetical protein